MRRKMGVLERIVSTLVGIIAVVGIATQAFAVIDTLTIDREADLLMDGMTVRVTGQARCTAGDEAFASVSVIQPHGREFTSGGGFSFFICDGTLQTWEVLVPSNFDSYQNGPASARIQLFTSTPPPGSGSSTQAVADTIHLHK